MKSQRKPQSDKSAAEKRTERDESQNVPKIPQRTELTPEERFDEGQVRVEEYRDNRKGKGVIHRMIKVKTNNGTKSFMPLKPEWNNETNEFRLIAEAEIDGKIVEYYVTLTEKVG